MQSATDEEHARLVVGGGRLTFEIPWGLRAERAQAPGIGTGDPCIVPAAQAPRGDDNRLRINVGLVSVMSRAGDDKAILCRSIRRVILKDQPRPLALAINATCLRDRGGLSRRPIEAVKPDDEQVLGPGRDGVFLHPVEVALIGVVGIGVDCVRRHFPKKGLDLLEIAIPAIGAGNIIQVRLPAEDINRRQSVAVAPVVGEHIAGSL